MARISHTYEDLAVGDTASITRTVTPDDLIVFAHVSGNLNPLHLPATRAGDTASGQNPAPSMWLGSLFSAVMGNLLPGPGTLYDMQMLRFRARAHVGDVLTVTVRVQEKRPPDIIVLSTTVLRGDEVLVDGTAEVQPPAQHIVLEDGHLPELTVQRHRHVGRLLAACASLPPLATAVVVPEEENALRGALAGARDNLIRPILLGDATKIAAVAKACGLSLDGIAIEDMPSHDAAAARAVEMVHQGSAAAIMKGHLHTDELLRHVVKSQGGLRTTRRISHVFVMDAPDIARSAAGHRRGHQHRADAGRQDRHHAERDRPRLGAGHRAAARRHPRRGGDGESEDAIDDRCGLVVEDGGSRADPRRHR